MSGWWFGTRRRHGENMSQQTALVTTLQHWRICRQPRLLRLERAHGQACASLARTQAEIGSVNKARASSSSAPLQRPGSGALDPAASDDVSLGAYHALLTQREEGLQLLCWQLDQNIRACKADVAALNDRRVRSQRLVELLDRCRCVYEDAQLSLHAPQPALQEIFEAVVCAPRTREGRLLSRWVALADPLTPPPAVVLDFAMYLSRLVVATHGLKPQLERIHLCTSRMLLHAVQPALWPSFAARHALQDATLVRQQRRMRAMTPAQLGVEPRFCTDTPPLAAASVLSDFCYLMAPVDQLLCLYRAIGLVHEIAAGVANVSPSVIGADALLPLLVWVVVHASLPQAFAALEYAKQLSTREHCTSELGYYLACLEAACAYVHDATPDADGAPSSTAPSATSAEQVAQADDALRGGGGETLMARLTPNSRTSGLDEGSGSGQQQQLVEEEVAGRKALARFLQHEREVNELVEALAL